MRLPPRYADRHRGNDRAGRLTSRSIFLVLFAIFERFSAQFRNNRLRNNIFYVILN